jgi:hypothetical protein
MTKKKVRRIMPLEYITAREFGLFQDAFTAFRTELRLQLTTGFDDMTSRLDEINGRGHANTVAVSVLSSRLDKVDADDSEIAKTVAKIERDGCGQLQSHGAIVNEMHDEAPMQWPRRKQVAISGGLLAGGAGLWELVHAVLDHFMKVGP